jgi:hypothetical protein
VSYLALLLLGYLTIGRKMLIKFGSNLTASFNKMCICCSCYCIFICSYTINLGRLAYLKNLITIKKN